MFYLIYFISLNPQVDPRWTDELVPGRRLADSIPDSETPGPEETQARFVFCSRVPKPNIVYAYADNDSLDPRDLALVSWAAV